MTTLNDLNLHIYSHPVTYFAMSEGDVQPPRMVVAEAHNIGELLQLPGGVVSAYARG